MRAVALNHLARIPAQAGDRHRRRPARPGRPSPRSRRATPRRRPGPRPRAISVRLLREGVAADRARLREAGLQACGTPADTSTTWPWPGWRARCPGRRTSWCSTHCSPGSGPTRGSVSRTSSFVSPSRSAAAPGTCPTSRTVWGQPARTSTMRRRRGAMALWLAPPATRDARVAELVTRDSSAVAVPAVAEALASRRTDLLDKVLGKAPQGRFVTKGVRIVPSVARHCHRWVPRQVDRYRALLGSVVGDLKANPWSGPLPCACWAGCPARPTWSVPISTTRCPSSPTPRWRPSPGPTTRPRSCPTCWPGRRAIARTSPSRRSPAACASWRLTPWRCPSRPCWLPARSPRGRRPAACSRSTGRPALSQP